MAAAAAPTAAKSGGGCMHPVKLDRGQAALAFGILPYISVHVVSIERLSAKRAQHF